MASDDKRKQRVTLIDVAREAGVSRATASLVIRNSPLAAVKTRERVEAAIARLGYVRNLTAARLRASQTRMVGLIVPNLTNPFFAELLSGVEEIIDDAGLIVILANSHDSACRQSALMRRMREHGVDGIILCPASDTTGDFLDDQREWQLSVVQVLRHITRSVDYVGVDYAGGMNSAVDYLVSLGHERIAFAIQGGLHSAFEERSLAFDRAMSRHNLNAGFIVRVPETLAEIAQTAVPLLFAGMTLPTATICFNDIVAMGLSSGLYDHNIRVGHDHSIIGFDHVRNGEAMRPRLTSVSTYSDVVGRRAAQRLLVRLADPNREVEWDVIKTDLHIGDSCGPALNS
ncbi:LacI family DNA-binding transcriptional regulator [Agrobacterium rhizogenes]|uniref:LacI family DNA-binding transcriptional regulator n=1 Tax=Rhizobium rhizogenes TaxID=359 RepID=UPI00115ECC21|nr:LacI family DNA-binding transcriptional regulator [Rhizobium rhizogenes]NTG90914.1 LacI family DNA-binding transcriptional regulator [Rhizobium rhizogenes]NTI20187.1 LacI family DNA-binding transcriptional regulator [Rhizobium rhizogenes]NTI39235.1 LacI family DNA-binding transcriptional regulator [Rhizobium rhizogenes]TRB19790.1 LacI family DNA-binding transcriptional regulator [Rhizobium rhizogenes]WEO69049.1 LacI family DNA-binding transcriptional regulator [Rhizobium rhizogenes]